MNPFSQSGGGYDVLVVEGEFTRSGVGNDLYDNTKSLCRVICPATNAFDRYDEIIDAIVNHVHRGDDSIILCLLGPAATVLAYDLFKRGYRALDLGHIDIEYEWFLHGTEYKSPVEGKAVNELGGNHPKNPIGGSEYEKQIVARIL